MKTEKSWSQYLLCNLKLAGYFATHIQAGGGGLLNTPKIFETANN